MSKKKIGRFVGYGLLYIGLLLFGFVAVMPFIWMVRSSFMEIKQIFIMPPQWIPDPFTLDNYVQVFTKTDIPKYFGNTVFVVVTNLIGVLLTSSMAAYHGLCISCHEKQGGPVDNCAQCHTK